MTAATRKRREYTEDFKRDAVALVAEQGYKPSEAARCLGVVANLIRRWKREFEEEASGARLRSDDREELQRLRKENRMLRMEKEILKSQRILREGNEVKYGFIRGHARRWPVIHQCRLLGGQSSAYYDWRDKPCKVIPQ